MAAGTVEKQTNCRLHPHSFSYLYAKPLPLVTINFTPRAFILSQLWQGVSESCYHSPGTSKAWVWWFLPWLWMSTSKNQLFFVFCARRQAEQKQTFCKLIIPRRSRCAFLTKAISVGKHGQTSSLGWTTGSPAFPALPFLLFSRITWALYSFTMYISHIKKTSGHNSCSTDAYSWVQFSRGLS